MACGYSEIVIYLICQMDSVIWEWCKRKRSDEMDPVFFVCENQQRVRAYLAKSPKNCKQTIKLFLNFYKQG